MNRGLVHSRRSNRKWAGTLTGKVYAAVVLRPGKQLTNQNMILGAPSRQLVPCNFHSLRELLKSVVGIGHTSHFNEATHLSCGFIRTQF